MSAPEPSNPYNGTTTPCEGDREQTSLIKIAASIKSVAEALGGGGVESEVTQHVALLGASETATIPAGALAWSFVVLTGTATVGGVAGVPAGVGDQGNRKLAANFVITTAGASSAYVRWETY